MAYYVLINIDDDDRYGTFFGQTTDRGYMRIDGYVKVVAESRHMEGIHAAVVPSPEDQGTREDQES